MKTLQIPRSKYLRPFHTHSRSSGSVTSPLSIISTTNLQSDTIFFALLWSPILKFRLSRSMSMTQSSTWYVLPWQLANWCLFLSTIRCKMRAASSKAISETDISRYWFCYIQRHLYSICRAMTRIYIKNRYATPRAGMSWAFITTKRNNTPVCKPLGDVSRYARKSLARRQDTRSQEIASYLL